MFLISANKDNNAFTQLVDSINFVLLLDFIRYLKKQNSSKKRYELILNE